MVDVVLLSGNVKAGLTVAVALINVELLYNIDISKRLRRGRERGTH